MPITEKIRIKLKSYDARLIEKSAKRIALTARGTGADVRGPIPLPTKKTLISVIRSPFVHKTSREQFFYCVHKRLIEIINPTQETVEKLSKLDLPAGVDVKIEVSVER